MGLIKGVLIFLTGLYVGIYLAQNHDIPQVENPKDIYERAKDWLSGQRDDTESGDGDLLYEG